MDWLIQEAAKDLVNAEEEVIGEEHGGERREEDGVDEGLPEEEEEEEDKGVGEDSGGARSEEPLPEDGVGEKQGRALGTVFREVSSTDTGVGENAGTILNGEEQGGTWTEGEEEEEGRALTGEGERCLRLGLKAEGAVVRPMSWPGVAMAGLGLSTRLDVSMEGLEGGRLPEGRLEMGRLLRDREPCWSGSLEVTEKHRLK